MKTKSLVFVRSLPTKSASDILKAEVGRKWPPSEKSRRSFQLSDSGKDRKQKAHFRLCYLWCTLLLDRSKLRHSISPSLGTNKKNHALFSTLIQIYPSNIRLNQAGCSMVDFQVTWVDHIEMHYWRTQQAHYLSLSKSWTLVVEPV